MNVINEPGVEQSAFTFQRVGWVEMISNSVPAHCEDIKVNLQEAFGDDLPIERVDAYACALATASFTPEHLINLNSQEGKFIFENKGSRLILTRVKDKALFDYSHLAI